MNSALRALQALVWFVVGAACAMVILALALEALPVGGDGVYAADPTPEWPVAHLTPNHRYVYSAGWNLRNVRKGAINNMGYVAPFDYVAGTPGVVVFGDSFVESLMNPYEQTVQGLLAKELHMPVMQFGVSAASMADYLGVAALVSKRFKPTWAVLVITDGDFLEGFSASEGYFHWSPSQPMRVTLTPERVRSPLVKLVRQFALVRYLRYNIKVTPARFLAPRRAEAPGNQPEQCEPVSASPSDTQLVQHFVRELPRALALDPSHVVLVFDSDRAALYGAHPRCPSRDSEAQRVLREVAQSHGMNVVETQKPFADFYARTHQRVDYSPLDGHWNADGHRIVADEVARAIINHTNSAEGPSVSAR
jgi:hypothetical protein